MISEASLAALRTEVGASLSERRFLHTLGVEHAALEIGRHCLPNKLSELSAAAILHDAAKELPKEDQLGFMMASGIDFTDEDYASEALYHAFCAPAYIRERFPKFATDEIVSSVFLHTSGGEDMTVFDEVIFLAVSFSRAGRSPSCGNRVRKSVIACHKFLDNSTFTAAGRTGNNYQKSVFFTHLLLLHLLCCTLHHW